jgi:hypothetical protein
MSLLISKVPVRYQIEHRVFKISQQVGIMKKVLITINILAFPIESFQFKRKYKPIRQREKLTRGYSLL